MARRNGLCGAVSLRVGLGGFISMVGSMGLVPLGYLCVVCSLLVGAGFMMFGCFPVMTGGVLVMFGGLGVVMRCVLRHRWIPFKWKDSLHRAGEPVPRLCRCLVTGGFQLCQLTMNIGAGHETQSNFQRVTPLGNCFSGIANTVLGLTTCTGPILGSSSQPYLAL